MKRRFGVIGALLVLAAAAGAFAWYATRIPAVADQLPPQPTALFARIRFPFAAARVPLGRTTAVQATAWGGESVKTIQLWIDGAPTAAQAMTGSGPFEAAFDWQPVAPGEHLLLVRAQGADGTVVTSEIVRVSATGPAGNPPAGGGDRLVVSADPEETLADLAESFDMTPGQVLALNPSLGDLAPDQPLPADIPLSLLPPPAGGSGGLGAAPNPLPATAQPTSGTRPPPTRVSPPPPADAPAARVEEPNPIWFDIKRRFGGATPPAAPEVAIAVDGCAATLIFTPQGDGGDPPAGDGFFVYRAAAGQSRFERIATLAAGDAPAGDGPQSFQTDAALGQNLYYVAAFNAAGEAPSAIVSAPVADTACATPAQHRPRLDQLLLKPTVAVDRAYCYAAIDGGPWTRMPAQGFVAPAGGSFDFAGQLNLAGLDGAGTLDTECWGWAGGTLRNLGKAQSQIDPGAAQPFELKGENYAAKGIIGGDFTTALPGESIDFSLPGDLIAVPAPFDIELISDRVAKQHTMLWRWEPFNCAEGEACADQIDGYKVLDTHHAVVATIDGFANKQATFKRNGDGECYSVAAFKGGEQSAPSDLACDDPVPPPAIAKIPPPTNLREIASAAECYAAAPSNAQFWHTICDTNLASKAKILAWNWIKTSCFPAPAGQPADCAVISDIEGFRLYDHINGTPAAVATTGPGIFLAFFPPTQGVHLTDFCFSARAYKGDLESIDSNALCITPPALLNAASYLLDPSGFDTALGIWITKTVLGNDKEFYRIFPHEFTPFSVQQAANVMYIHRALDVFSKRQTVWFDQKVYFTLPDTEAKIESVSLRMQLNSENYFDTGVGITHHYNDAKIKSNQFSCVDGGNIKLGKAFRVWKPDPRDWVGTGSMDVDLTSFVQKAVADGQTGPLVLSLNPEHFLHANNDLCTTLITFKLFVSVKP